MRFKCIAVTLPVGLALAVAGCETYSFKHEIPFQKAADLDGIEKVEVTTRNGRVTVSCVDGIAAADIKGVKFARGTSADDAKAHAEKIIILVERSENDPKLLVITVRIPDEIKTRSPGAAFEVTLPPELDLAVTTKNGKVRVTGTRGDVAISTSNGTVDVTDVAGDLDLRSSNGTISIDKSGRSKVKATTSNGKIIARDVTGSTVLETSNGSVRLTVLALPESPEISVRTSNGDVHVELPRTVNATLEMKTSNGRINTNFGESDVKVLESGKKRLRAKLNDGGGTIKIRSGNGSLTYRSS